MDNLTIEYKDIKDLTPADYNPRRLTKDRKQAILDSIKKFGMTVPIVVNMYEGRENVIIGGHQRVKVLKEQGISKVPCIIQNLPIELERELNVRLNANNGDWDYELLTQNFKLDELEKWGMTEAEIAAMEGTNEIDEQLSSGEKEDFDQKIELKVTEETYSVWVKWQERLKTCLDIDSESKAFEYAIIEALNVPEERLKR